MSEDYSVFNTWQGSKYKVYWKGITVNKNAWEVPFWALMLGNTKGLITAIVSWYSSYKVDTTAVGATQLCLTIMDHHGDVIPLSRRVIV